MNFSSPGDGINSDLNGESPGYFHERLYPSVDSLINSDSFEEIDSDTNSIAESVASLGTPPRCRKYLYPKKEYVDHLQPEEIRWFYKREGDKKWLPFIGYDSLRIECRYRVQQQNGTDGLSEAEIADLDLILVRGGLYEVDVPNANCKPVYWSGDQYKIMRGTWFYDQTWQPVEEGFATQIETEYLSTFLGHRLDEMSKAPVKGPRPVVLNIRFTDFYIEWNSPVDAFMFSDSASSRLIRAVGHKLGVQKTGSRVHRGYCLEAMMDDKPTDISHLIFVVHGIGQKMDTGHIVRCAQELRDRMHYVTAKLFPNFEHNENRRAEFLPVEWRSSLKLDGDTVESLTPQKMRGIRTMLNASAMDVLYYSSPLYRSEITRSLEAELNRLYKMFCERHPYFEPNGGKVSIVAHSLGCVITYDIITGWNPITLYDQYVSSVIDEEREQAGGSQEVQSELDKAKHRVNEVESVLNNIHNKQLQQSPPLSFEVENLFCLGSPLGVFLALRGVRPQAKGTLDHIIPKHISTRLFNIYHPSDPVAYRLEPLVLKHYSTVHPLVIHRYDTADKTPYTQIQSKAFAAFQGSSEVLSEKAETDSVDSASCSTASKESSPTRKRIALNTDLEYRLDYTLQESGGITRGYISVVTSHTSYWTNRDIACFILTQLHPSLQEKQLP
ncbi:phospholipase DDHD1-like isoform X2 [Mya arenaria]|uniref:phospholipase DDHD1-like isoform X2 n=1 Tax=Mya arenaria TaxID=6604 RepID=UPI0022E70D24|nr:phospholipase DDHD1-like isoform X2 [Mya arenaria]